MSLGLQDFITASITRMLHNKDATHLELIQSAKGKDFLVSSVTFSNYNREEMKYGLKVKILSGDLDSVLYPE